RDVAATLVEQGSAYYSFATAEQLDAFKREAREAGTSPAYDGSLEPSESEVAERLAAGETAVVRFKVPRPGVTEFTDIVRGDMRFEHAQVDDFVILRSNGTPTYHLASTVDDVDYEITHVIRGEDLLSSTPKHILLTQAMGAEPATYAHLSLLMGPDGKKLSKRHGDTAMAAYREAGYLPEAMNNYLALLGWNPGEDDTVLPLDEMVTRFDLDTVSKNPAVFDPKKLEWMNGVYIREMDEEEFAAATLPLLEKAVGRTLSSEDRERFVKLIPLVKERAKLLPEVASQARFLFVDIDSYDEKAWSKVMAVDEGPIALDGAIAALEGLDLWTTDAIDAALRTMLEENELSARKGFQPIRVAISGSTVSPPLFESLEILGRDESLARLRTARAALS
ncbi:MAG: glutamate--tRNA ligase, partial [Actinomycetota bacterium]|nr:glutamate--tRNA ligase [Actinomycetota bacterium]